MFKQSPDSNKSVLPHPDCRHLDSLTLKMVTWSVVHSHTPLLESAISSRSYHVTSSTTSPKRNAMCQILTNTFTFSWIYLLTGLAKSAKFCKDTPRETSVCSRPINQASPNFKRVEAYVSSSDLLPFYTDLNIKFQWVIGDFNRHTLNAVSLGTILLLSTSTNFCLRTEMVCLSQLH